jgi:ribosomal-protein-alanine N-acetyltransferase
VQLATERLVLREFVEDDWRAVVAIETAEVVRFMTQEPATEASAREYVQRGIVSASEVPRTVFDLAVTLAGSNDMIGRCGMKRTDGEPREAALWFVVHARHAGQGYMTEAARALLGVAFDELRLHRVYGDCDPRNPASRRVLEKLGMRHEAHLVENVWIKNEWCDSMYFAMLDREWREWAARS